MTDAALFDYRTSTKAEEREPEPFDWYIEPAWCHELLYQVESFEGEIVDPACGLGTGLKVAADRGHAVLGIDIVDRREHAVFPFPLRLGDFAERPPINGGENFIGNPPFSYRPGIAEIYIRRCLALARAKVAMLLPVKFLSSQGRYDLFTQTPLTDVRILSSRPSMPPGSLFVQGLVEAKGGIVDYMWLVWDVRKRPSCPRTSWLLLPEHTPAPKLFPEFPSSAGVAR